MKEIFAALGKLRFGLYGLRHEFSWWGPDDENEKRRVLASRLDQFKKYYDTLINTASSLYPFVPQEIYLEIEACGRLAYFEMVQIETAGNTSFTLAWFEDGAKQRETFDGHYYEAANRFRKYFNNLSIISDQRLN